MKIPDGIEILNGLSRASHLPMRCIAMELMLSRSRHRISSYITNTVKCQIDYEPRHCSRSGAVDGIRHVLGNFVAADFGIRTFRRGPGSGFKTTDEQAAAERFAEITSNRLRIRGSVVLV